MPSISKEKKEKIQEQLIYFLFTIFPKQVFTSDIAKELARDEEFIKKLLLELESKGVLIKIDKNSQGVKYERRKRWRISNETYEIYNKHQQNQQNISQKVEQNL
jgi:predicted transcriptional regulator with HTH domain